MGSTRRRRHALSVLLLMLSGIAVAARAPGRAADCDEPARAASAKGVRFSVSFAASARREPLTGRVYVAVGRRGRRPPIRQAGETGAPLYGVDVHDLAPGAQVAIDDGVRGYPVERLSELPPGEYRVQAFANVYTRCPRSDGHTIWVHLDAGEGQSWRRSPGNLFSAPRDISIGPNGATEPVPLVLDQVIPPLPDILDTAWVRRFRVRSKLLSEFWGVPMELGATVLLPRGYDEHPEQRYPVLYIQGHHSRAAPFGFGRGGRSDALWRADDTPRFIAVTFQHASPYYDDSYGVDSENNGPYGRALVKELIPEVERRYRAIGAPWARQLSGGSTGGWIALALQIFHPEFFGGCWASCPDPVDFRCHQIVNIYRDANAYLVERGWLRVERPARRRTDGGIELMMKDENRWELAVGTHSRSGGQWDIWEATFSPVGEDGYPRRLWNKYSGEIDHDVAAYWREHYDLRHILERDWPRLGPHLRGKLHIFVGDMDSYYLNNGVVYLEQFLDEARDPPADAVVEYGRGEGHCWGPGAAELLRRVAEHVVANAPDGTDTTGWRP